MLPVLPVQLTADKACKKDSTVCFLSRVLLFLEAKVFWQSEIDEISQVHIFFLCSSIAGKKVQRLLAGFRRNISTVVRYWWVLAAFWKKYYARFFMTKRFFYSSITWLGSLRDLWIWLHGGFSRQQPQHSQLCRISTCRRFLSTTWWVHKKAFLGFLLIYTDYV